MTKTVLGVFSDQVDVEVAVNKLREVGINPSDISILMKDLHENNNVSRSGAETASNTLTGATAGMALGGLAGLLASFAVPGLGSVFVGGPIAGALGLTGAAATIASGAATGALAGGVVGALTGFGLSEKEARYYEERLNQGAILVAVPVHTIDYDLVLDILEVSNANDITAIEPQQETYAFSDKSGYDNPSLAYAGIKGGRAKYRQKKAGKSKSKHRKLTRS